MNGQSRDTGNIEKQNDEGYTDLQKRSGGERRC